jgi:hypothetical protein
MPFMNIAPDTFNSFKEKMQSYSNCAKEKEWLQQNSSLIRKLFENVRMRDFVFEPFRGVFQYQEDNLDERIMSTITQVAIANAVLAGLPGKLGIGVAVSICLEAWMAYTIARSVGIDIKNISDVWKYFGLLSGTAVTIVWGFKAILGFAFSLFAVVGFLPATVLAELLTTNAIGVLFWFGFVEAKQSGSFRIPKRMFLSMKERFTDLYEHQKDFTKSLCNKKNLQLVFNRLKLWLGGDIAVTSPAMRGEVFAFASMAYLIQGEYGKLEGPLGKLFIESIRRAYPVQLGDATLEEMSRYFSERLPISAGHLNLVKGEMFEHLVEYNENGDSDSWTAELHEIRTVPGSDIIFTNMETGDQVEVSLKSTEMPDIIETALKKYPDIPILTTKEVEQYFGEHPLIDYADVSDVELERVTKDNFERLVEKLEPINAVGVAASGAISKAIGSLWPFVMAYIRKKITNEQLQRAMTKVLGESGVSLASRVSFAIVLGPVFAWYLLARSVLFMVKSAQRMGN